MFRVHEAQVVEGLGHVGVAGSQGCRSELECAPIKPFGLVVAALFPYIKPR